MVSLIRDTFIACPQSYFSTAKASIFHYRTIDSLLIESLLSAFSIIARWSFFGTLKKGIFNWIKPDLSTNKTLISMSKKSAGILLYRFTKKSLEIFLVHPGGPFWKNKDAGAWSIPKGEFDDNEEPLDAAVREMKEETGITLKGNFIELTPVKQKSGKLVYAWALEHDIDPSEIKSNEFEIEWPPKSGKKKNFPEIDKADWFDLKIAKEKMNQGQVFLLEELEKKLKNS